MTRIADCAEILPGYALKVRMEHEPEGTHQIILGKHLSGGSPYRYNTEHELRITPKGPVDKYRVSAGDVLFVSRGSQNHAVKVESVPDTAVASATFYILRTHDGIDAGYLAWCLNQAPVQAQIGQSLRISPSLYHPWTSSDNLQPWAISWRKNNRFDNNS